MDVELDQSDIKRLGIIADADYDLPSRWQALRNILINFGYNPIPTTPDQNGTVVEQTGKPVIGIWLMPDNTLPGMLEDFLRSLVPQDDTLWPIATQCVDKVMEIDRRFPTAHRSKATIHTWLAWQKAPGTPFGSAINEKFLSADAPQALSLITWIRRLFDLTPP